MMLFKCEARLPKDSNGEKRNQQVSGPFFPPYLTYAPLHFLTSGRIKLKQRPLLSNTSYLSPVVANSSGLSDSLSGPFVPPLQACHGSLTGAFVLVSLCVLG